MWCVLSLIVTLIVWPVHQNLLILQESFVEASGERAFHATHTVQAQLHWIYVGLNVSSPVLLVAVLWNTYCWPRRR